MADYDPGRARDTSLDGGLRPATRADMEHIEAELRELLAVVREMAGRHDTMDRRIQQIEAMVTQLTFPPAAAQPTQPSEPAAAPPTRSRRTQSGAAKRSSK